MNGYDVDVLPLAICTAIAAAVIFFQRRRIMMFSNRFWKGRGGEPDARSMRLMYLPVVVFGLAAVGFFTWGFYAG